MFDKPTNFTRGQGNRLRKKGMRKEKKDGIIGKNEETYHGKGNHRNFQRNT